MKSNILLVLCLLWKNCFSLNSTLELVHVIFRHGSRAPTKFELCKNDPHMELWKTLGFGELTPIGQEKSFELGNVLRNLYMDFLPTSYTSNMILTKTSKRHRTKMTALLVLSGLFSKSFDNSIQLLNSSRLPYEHSESQDLEHAKIVCPAYVKEFSRVRQTSSYQTALNKYKIVLQMISEKCQKTYNTLLDSLFIFQVLYSEKYLNLSIPSWAEAVYNDLYHTSALELYFENYNTLLKRLNGGKFLKTILENLKNKSNNVLIPNERKLFLYSAHDVNVVNVLAVLGLFKPHFPNYNSAVLLELHHEAVSNKYYVEVLYIDGVGNNPQQLFIESCGYPCELQNFENLLKPYIPDNYTKECEL